MKTKKDSKPKRKYTRKEKLVTVPSPAPGGVTEVATIEKHWLAPTPEKITEQKLIEYMNAFGLAKKLTDAEKIQFISIAREFNLNPFKREIHVTVYNADDPEKRTLSLVVGYEVYLKRAERLNVLDGWGVRTEGDGLDNLKAIAEIYRKDRKHPFIHEVYYKEAFQTKYGGEANSFWKKMPRFMLKKVAAAQAFRLCFPDDMGGIPFIEGEPDPALDEDEKPSAPKRVEGKHAEVTVIDDVTEVQKATLEVFKKADELDKEIADAEKIVGQEIPDADLFKAIVKKCNESKTIPTERKVKAMGDARASKFDPAMMRKILAELG